VTKVAILTLGSRGDVQPYVALGRGLQAAGHDVVLATAAQFESFVTGCGVHFAPLDPAFLGLTETQAGRAAFEKRSGGLALFKQVMPIFRRVLDDCWVAAQGADAVVYHVKALAGYHIAEKLGVPAFVAMPLPVAPTRAFANPILPARLPAFANRWSFGLNSMGKAPFMGAINDWRQRTLGLPPRGRFASEAALPGRGPVPILHAYSPAVVPRPPDWPSHVAVTGYWFLDGAPGWQPPAALQAFLDGGPPPVYVGFGSMTSADPAARARLVVDALLASGQRGVIASGWAGLRPSDLPPSIYLLDQAPHDWLFPRMAAAVHHGGAGTTAAGLRAGRPTVVVPFFGDQPFWGTRVHALGAGPAPIPQKRLTVDALAAAIRQAAADPALRAAAEGIGAAIRCEDGVGNAVRFIEHHLTAVSP
jgi:sterol 3beta-glucosyltransferase